MRNLNDLLLFFVVVPEGVPPSAGHTLTCSIGAIHFRSIRRASYYLSCLYLDDLYFWILIYLFHCSCPPIILFHDYFLAVYDVEALCRLVYALTAQVVEAINR